MPLGRSRRHEFVFPHFGSGRIVGFQPSKRQPLPGIQKLRSAWTIFAPMMQLSRDYRKYGMEDELNVGN